jgi:hypothetical protein
MINKILFVIATMLSPRATATDTNPIGAVTIVHSEVEITYIPPTTEGEL